MVLNVGDYFQDVSSILFSVVGVVVFVYLMYKLFSSSSSKKESDDEARLQINEQKIEKGITQLKSGVAGVKVDLGNMRTTANLISTELGEFSNVRKSSGASVSSDDIKKYSAEVKVLLEQFKKQSSNLVSNMELVVSYLKSELTHNKKIISVTSDEINVLKSDRKQCAKIVSSGKDLTMQANGKKRVELCNAIIGLNQAILQITPRVVSAQEAHLKLVKDQLKTLKDAGKKMKGSKNIEQLRGFFVQFEANLVLIEKVYVAETGAVLVQIERDDAEVLASIHKRKPLYLQKSALEEEFEVLKKAENKRKAMVQAAEKEALAAAK